MKSVSKNELVKLLSICGQVAEHKSEKMQEHGRDEQELLQTLLRKLQKQWLQDHAEHHRKTE